MTQPLITGVGISDFGRFPQWPEEALAQAAILAALDDAGVAMSQVQAFYCGGHMMMHLGQMSAWRRMEGLGAA